MSLTSLPMALSKSRLSLFARRIQTFPASSRNLSLGQIRQYSATHIQVSAGQDEKAVLEQATTLIEQGKWQLCVNGRGLERTFQFKGFKSTWGFMNHVAAECKKQKHHPEWTNIYSTTRIRWTTHNPEGLSSKDTYMARFCDEAGEQFGEVPAKPSSPDTEAEWSLDAGDCCGGKTSKAKK